MRMGGYEGYKVRLSLAGKYRIGLNIVRTGKIGVKGLFLEYGEYSAEYSPTPSLKPLSRLLASPLLVPVEYRYIGLLGMRGCAACVGGEPWGD